MKNYRRWLPSARGRNRGSLLIELLIAIGIAALIIPATVTALLGAQQGAVRRQRRVEATLLMETTTEIVRVLKRADWANIATNGTFHPIESGNTWILQSGSEAIGPLLRQVQISSVYRDENGNLVSPLLGSLDPGSKSVQVMVSWTEPLPGSVSQTFLITRYDDPAYATQTTESDFIGGDGQDVVVTDDFGGEVILSSGGSGSWCTPDQSVTATVDLPKNGVATSLSAVEGWIFAGTGENASGVSVASVTVDNADPPNAAVFSTLDGYKTNAVFTDGNYGYIATDTNSSEVVIVDSDVDPIVAVGTVDLPGSADAFDVMVEGTVGYAVQGSTLWSFDASSGEGERAILDSDGVSLAGQGVELVASGDYVFVAVDANPVMQVVDVSNPANLSVVGQLSITGAVGTDVTTNSSATRAYVTTTGSASEMHIVNIESKTGEVPVIATYTITDMEPRAVIVVPGNRAIIGGRSLTETAQEYQVVNITNEQNPQYCGGFDFDTTVNDVVAILESDGDAFSYAMTDDASAELKVIKGGPGGSTTDVGVFTSSVLDFGAPVLYHRFQVDEQEPFGSQVRYQFAGADPVAGDCLAATYSFRGPDGTASTWYATSSAIPSDDDGSGYENPAQCFKYRAELSTTDSDSTPVLYEASVVYSQ